MPPEVPCWAPGSGKVELLGKRWLQKEGRCQELRKRGENLPPGRKPKEFRGSQELADLTGSTQSRPGLALEWNKARAMEKVLGACGAGSMLAAFFSSQHIGRWTDGRCRERWQRNT